MPIVPVFFFFIPLNPSSERSLFPSIAIVAKASHLSLYLFPSCPLTHRKSTFLSINSKNKLSHKSSFCLTLYNPFAVFTTYCESEYTSIFFPFSISVKAAITAIISMRLFVVFAYPLLISLISPVSASIIIAPIPPGPPGLYLQPPSV